MALRNSFIYIIILLILQPYVSAQNEPIHSGQLEFIKNKGQWNDKVIFMADLRHGALFLEKECFTFNFVDPDDQDHVHDGHMFEKNTEHITHYHAYKINFTDAHNNVSIKGLNVKTDYCNYYIGNDRSKWASRVPKYSLVEYSEIYPDIDLKIYSRDNLIKYDFVLKPGADHRDITLEYEGLDDIRITNGNLVIKTSVNEILELKPFAYQKINGKIIEIPCQYKLEKNRVIFLIKDKYDKSKTLIIDPTLIFSTYTGSTADNWGFTATFDKYGNVYSGGNVFGTGYPTSTGAFQEDYVLRGDIGIIKYDSLGLNRLFATYLGGQYPEIPHSLFVNELDELLVLGTTSSADFPTSPTAYDTTFNGGDYIWYTGGVIFENGCDIFVSKFSPDGSQLQGSTFIGGTANDGINLRHINGWVLHKGNDSLYFNFGDGARGEIITDDHNNVYVGSCTFSNDFPITGFPFQSVSGGLQEGVVFKFDKNLTNLVWSSYIGGSADDAVHSIDTDKNYDILIAGGTNSLDFPTTQGAYQPYYLGGSADAFVAHISQDGSTLFESSFFGSSEYDQAYFVRNDNDDNIYITGQTKAPDSTLIYNALYSRSNSGQFIAKFTPSLSTIEWSTVFGTGNGKPNISPTAFEVDICNRTYLCGLGREHVGGYPGATWQNIEGTKNMEITANAFQDTTDGMDFYFMVMGPDAVSLDYATFFGEIHDSINRGSDHVDGGTSRCDKRGNLYQSACASCGGNNGFPTYPPNVWSSTNNSSNCNNAVFKFNFNYDFAIAEFSVPSIGCAPFTVQFDNNSMGANYIWDFGDGSTISTIPNPTHTYNNPGFYNITLIANNPASCNLTDTIIKQIQILGDTSYRIPEITMCKGYQTQIGITPSSDTTITYNWIPTNGISDSTVANPYASPSSTTDYSLVVSNGICTDTIFQQVIVTGTNVFIGNDTLICLGDTLGFDAGPGFVSYLWQDGSTGQSFSANQSGLYWVEVEDSVGCKSKDILQLTIPLINVDIGNDTSICSGDTVIFDTGSGFTTYLWNNGSTNQSIVCNTAGNYWVEISDTNNCYGYDTVNLQLYSLPHPDIGNDTSICIGNSILMDAGHGFATYLWNDGSMYQVIVANTAGVYWVMVSDTNNCLGYDTINVNYYPVTTIDLGNDTTLCEGESLLLDATNTNGTYLWQDNSTNPIYIVTVSGTYWVKVSDTNNCLGYDTINVFYNSLTTVDLGNDTILCQGETIIIDATTSNVTYIWQDNSTNPTFSVTQTGTYWVAITDSCGTTVDSINVYYNSLPIVNLGNDTSLCQGENLTLDVTTPYASYLWQDNTTDSILLVDQQGNYWVKVTANNCSNTDSINIVYLLLPIVDIGKDTTICRGEYLLLDVTRLNASYLWQDNSTEPTLLITENGEYWVVVTEDKCSASDTIKIVVEECEVILEMPNVFSPNGDGFNERFIPIVMENVIQANLLIYNRWGKKVCESNNLHSGWDGRINGKQCSEGVYFWIVKYKGINNKDYQQSGSVTVLR